MKVQAANIQCVRKDLKGITTLAKEYRDKINPDTLFTFYILNFKSSNGGKLSSEEADFMITFYKSIQEFMNQVSFFCKDILGKMEKERRRNFDVSVTKARDIFENLSPRLKKLLERTFIFEVEIQHIFSEKRKSNRKPIVYEVVPTIDNFIKQAVGLSK